MRDELAALPDISLVEVTSARPYEISIEVSETALRRHGLTFDDVAAAVRNSSLDLPGGSVRSGLRRGSLLRTIGQAYRGDEYEALPLLTRADGTRLVLGDVATVVDGFAETDQSARFNLAPTVLLSVFRTGDQDALDIADRVEQYAARTQATLPAGISITVWQNVGEIIDSQLRLMLRTGGTGFLLVFILLSLFLELRLAFWVSLGIPISFLGAIMLMPGLGLTLNFMSLFAFILVLGIVVDDAIIVGENIYAHQERHGEGLRGSIEGAREIATPVIFAVLTTVAAFMPLLFVPGMMGKVFSVIPLVSSCRACCSRWWSRSTSCRPHLSHIPARRRAGPWRRFQRHFADGLKAFIRRVYRPVLEVGLQWRYATAATGLSMLIVTVGIVLGGWTSFHFFPSMEAPFMSASLTMPLGTPVQETAAAVQRIEDGADNLRRELIDATGEDYFVHIFTAIGDQPLASRQGPMGPVANAGAAHLGEVVVELAASDTRAYSSEQLGNRWPRAHRRDPRGGRPEVQRLRHVRRGGAGRHAGRAEHGPAAGGGRGRQGRAARVHRRLRRDRFIPGGQARDEAGHQARGGVAGAEPGRFSAGRSARRSTGRKRSASSAAATTSVSWCAIHWRSGARSATWRTCGSARPGAARCRSVTWRRSIRAAGLRPSSASIATARST